MLILVLSANQVRRHGKQAEMDKSRDAPKAKNFLQSEDMQQEAIEVGMLS